jgi:serine/threonine protein kinase/Flp pilus assembly protein TadD
MGADLTEPREAGEPLELEFEHRLDEMVAAMRHSPSPRAEEVLARLPGLTDEDAVRVVFEEACLRLERGEGSVTAEILGRFPRWAPQLGLLLECKRLWMSGVSKADFPEVGDDLGDFRLLAALGGGALGRTFLASQRSLGGRRIVLKVAPLGQDEHLSLARLQHMHIVPLYVEQVFPDRNLRVLGMPYLGGASLARLLEELAEAPEAERSGSHLLAALDRCAVAPPPESASTGPFRRYFARATLVQALCGIGACVAEALQYAHDRGLIHFDVKPANVLIAADGQPMLLDFHLARGPILPGRTETETETETGTGPDRLGGTPGYLSPEQAAAMESLRTEGRVRVAVDGRSDLYSLGLLLYRALGGDDPGGTSPRRPLARCNPRISSGLSDILERCLARDPADRYPDAAALASDLRRHLSDLPLRGVANRDPFERWRKWRRRSPGALGRRLAGLGAGGLIVLVAAFGGVLLQQRGRQVEAALEAGRRHLSRGHHPEAMLALEQGLALAGSLPTLEAQRRALRADLGRASRARDAADLHDLVNLLRFRLGALPPRPDEAEALYDRGRQVWQARARFLGLAGAPPDAVTGRQVRADLLDLATILADLCAHRRPGRDAGGGSPLAEAVRILGDARDLLGPGTALCRDLGHYARALGQDDLVPAVIPEPQTAWEHYDLGRSYLRSGEYAPAAVEFERAIRMRPEEFWPHFYHGLCCARLGKPEAAVSSLGTAIALAPTTAACYYNRALAYQALGRDDDAIRDDTRALELDPRFTDAALNRGIVRLHAGQHAAALEDFAQARASASSESVRGLIAYNAALAHLARNDRPAAEACLQQAVVHGDTEALRLRERLRPP